MPDVLTPPPDSPPAAHDGPDFKGTHDRSLDAKHRLVLPPAWAEILRPGAVVCPGPHRTIALWPADTYRARERAARAARRAGGAAQAAHRFLVALSFDVEPDRQGRILLPPRLRDFAGLGTDVVLVGQGDFIEISNAPDFDAELESLDGRQVDPGALLL